MSSQREIRRARAIKADFENDPQKRFHMEGFHGKGGQGSIFKFKAGVGPGLETEKAILKLLQGCKHIVRMNQIDNDPLDSIIGERGFRWIYLDTVENGTLIDFMTRSKSAGIESLPNRLLWRIFLCMIRACIAMAWPRNSPNDNETSTGNIQPLGLTHEDMHAGNFMFGPFIYDSDHDITPIMKLIDFGLSRQYSNNMHPSGATCQQFNVLDIGIMMATLVRLLTNSKYTGEEIEIDLSKFGRPTDTETPASNILPDPLDPGPDPCPDVDMDLRCIIAACMASDPAHRPTLGELEKWVFSQGCNMKPADYANLPNGANWETDKSIPKILQLCIFDA